MATVTLTANRSAYTDIERPTYNNHTAGSALFSKFMYLFCGFPDLDAEYRRQELIAVRIHCPAFKAGYGATQIIAGYIRDEWDEEAVTWNNTPVVGSLASADVIANDIESAKLTVINILTSGDSTAILKIRYMMAGHGLRFNFDTGSANPYIFTSHATEEYRPRIEFVFGIPIRFAITDVAPDGGYINRHSAKAFSFKYSLSSTNSIDKVTATERGIQWKLGQDGEVHTIAASGTPLPEAGAVGVLVPADTFPSGNIYWRAYVKDDANAYHYSIWYVLNTTELPSTATINSPKNGIVDGSRATEFSWNHVISTGTEQTMADLQKSDDDGATWSNLATVLGNSTTTTIAANTFSAGQWKWRVRTYNTDNIAGSWSEEASFISVAAPTCTGLSINATPRPTLSWQSTGQVGYQIKLDSIDLGTHFGSETSFRVPFYIDEGEHSMSVRVCNQYTLWSDWKSVSFNVENTEGTNIILSASSNNAEAFLIWVTNVEEYDAFLICRDGVAIGKTTSFEYTDSLAIGEHTYSVRGIYEDSDNYTMSNSVSVDLNADCLMIADYETRTWMRLPLSASSMDEKSISITADSSTYRVSASDYPVAETTRYKNKSITFRVAFLNCDDAKAFENFVGRMVIVKTPRQEIFTGVLSSVSKTQNMFFEGFSCRVQHSYVAEEIEL